MPATVPGLRRDNVDVSRARPRKKRGKRKKETGVVGKRERGGEKRYALLTKFQGVSRDFNVFSCRRIATRRGSRRTVDRARSRCAPRTFIANESEFLLYVRNHSAVVERSRAYNRGPCARSSGVSVSKRALSEPNSLRNWPGEKIRLLLLRPPLFPHPYTHFARHGIFSPVLLPLSRHSLVLRDIFCRLYRAVRYTDSRKFRGTSCARHPRSCNNPRRRNGAITELSRVSFLIFERGTMSS